MKVNPFAEDTKTPGAVQVREVQSPSEVTDGKGDVVTPETQTNVVAETAQNVNVAAETVVVQSQAAQTTATAVAVKPTTDIGPVMSPAGVMDVTLDDDIKLNELDKYPKMKKDDVDRMALILFSSTGSPMIKMSHYFYDDVSKTLFLAPKNKQLLEGCVNSFGDPKIRFATPVIRYNTDQFGTLSDPLGYKIYAFVFSSDKFPTLKTLHREWGLQNHDILITCKGADYQKMDMQPAKEVIFRQNAEFSQQVTDAAELAYTKHLNRYMGRAIPDAEVAKILQAGQLMGSTPNPDNPFVNSQPAGASPAEKIAPAVGAQGTTGGGFDHLIKK